MGMEVRTLNEQLAAYFGAPNEEGVLVESVEEGSPAEKAGFKAGDVIIRVGKKTIDEVDEVHRTLRKYKEGDKVEFEVIRKGDRKILTYTKEAAPEPGEDHLFRVQPHFQRYFDGRKVLEHSTPGPDLKELDLEIERLNGDLRERLEEMPKVIKKTIRINAGSGV
jgi:predicted metalloprotease with PDZ domain